ncbi:MAG TPA: sigma-70 family RNA polymerase sigma factor, partial [Polyangiaceae bacterium]|nr:sigma-70 family RNA polymerase sigma factor [Polyangiaceae bacterium]
DAEAARAAEAEFYERHVEYLYAVLVSRVRRPLALSGREVEDLVQETFFRAFARAETFSAGDVPDEDSERRRSRAWLGRIAQRLLADWLADAREISASPYLETLTEPEPAPPSSRSPKLQLMCEALDTLSERERDVLRVAALYFRGGEEHQRLPNQVSAELARRWETTSENIRAIRSRATKKLKVYLETRLAALTELP